ncbi:hypothetical protein [Streptomyces sp. NPDC088910]|uniref:hypothetical protein n=1 Tax=Streptomyces sp. NPDC088910 TaxID=3365911 RepID=UPI0037F5D262
MTVQLDPRRAAYVDQVLASVRTKHTMAVAAWPRPDKYLPQVDIDVKWLRFSVLNHRTRAEQLQAAREAGVADLFQRDPLGEDAQRAQREILARQEGFGELKDDLEKRDQREPTIITADGILINGNRRTAAMFALNEANPMVARYVSCLVLPKDATEAELTDLETELQVAKDFKQGYSWINEALMIEELYDREEKNFGRVAERVHRKYHEVRDLYEKLQQVHQLVELSGGTRDYVDFEANETAFDELAKHIRNKPPAEANAVKNVYQLGTLSGVEYRKLRNLRRPDADRLVEAEMKKDPALNALLATALTQSQPVDELDELLGDAPYQSAVNSVLRLVADKAPESAISLDGQKEPTEIVDILGSVRAAVQSAAAEAKEDALDHSTLEAPLERAEHAVADIQRLLGLVPRARAHEKWDEAKLETLLAQVEALVERVRASA